METLRATLERAKIDRARLSEQTAAREPAEGTLEGDGEIKLALAEPAAPRQSRSLQFFRGPGRPSALAGPRER